MGKVITLSRNFPSYHPLKGQPTYFVEKFYKSINHKQYDEDRLFEPRLSLDNFEPKHHTIRAGKRWKDGDMASIRCWSGKPYYSKQIILAPDVKLKVLDVSIHITEVNGKKNNIGAIMINGKFWLDWYHLAKNDGLTIEQLEQWFYPSAPFEGQILIWNPDAINYDKILEARDY